MIEPSSLEQILFNFAERVESLPRGKTYSCETEVKAIQDYIDKEIASSNQKMFDVIIPDEGPDETTKGTYADGYTRAVIDITDNFYDNYSEQRNKLRGKG